MTEIQQDAFAHATPAGRQLQLRGTLEHITFFNPENQFTIGRLALENSPEKITVAGNLVGAHKGDTLELTGEFKVNPRYGRQFEIQSFRPILPATVHGLKNYLGSGMIKGIKGKTAEKLVEHFGMQLLEILDHDIERLREVRGIGAHKLGLIQKAWQEQQCIREQMLFMQEFDIPLTHAWRIYKAYGDRATLVLRDNPYQLTFDVRGIGFKTADKMAQKLGIAHDRPERIAAGFMHLLSAAADEGHCFLPYELISEQARELLAVNNDSLLNAVLKSLHEKNELHLEKLSTGTRAVYLHSFWKQECALAERIRKLAAADKELPRVDPAAELDQFERRYKFELAARQRQALELALTRGMLIVTGGPGTGKTTLVRALIDILRRQGRSIQLAAPTGRAAKRLGEVAEMPASTIHRLLKYNPHDGGFEFHAGNPLRAQTLILDECSMLDLHVAFHLHEAIPVKTVVVYVGDVDQLPSVGPGNVLGDLIRAELIPVVRLEEVFRQAGQSRIVTNAHRIQQGKMPEFTATNAASDFYFSERKEPAEAADLILQLVRERIPKKFRFDPLREIQVLTPTHRGPLGTQELNRRLQAELNPKGKRIQRGGRELAVGDKVMQLRNNYEKDIYNGDIGFIIALDEEEQALWVDYDGRKVAYDFNELDEIQLSYAISVHKSQGSEYPAVVLPVHTQHYVFLQRNLLYTAITRGKKLVCIAGTKKAVAMAVNNNQTRRRFTGLRERLTRTDSSATER